MKSPPKSIITTASQPSYHLNNHFNPPTIFLPTPQQALSPIKMYTSTIIATLFAAVAIAAPASTNGVTARAVNTAELTASAQTMLDAKAAAGCDVLSKLSLYAHTPSPTSVYMNKQLTPSFSECIAALAPASITCAAAFAEAGANPIADAACIATLASNIANKVFIYHT
jgi:hypothetical protein